MQITDSTYFDRRESGISPIGDLSWGNHLCQFYQTKEDLLEVLVPYLRAGLQNNEFCVWVTDGLLDVQEANKALRNAMPGFEEHVQKGQAEILSREQWCAGDGDPGSTIISKLDKAVSRGFDGLRLACNTLPEEMRGQDVRDMADAVCRYNVIAVFAYPRDRFDAIGLMAVVKNHRLALVKNAGRWEVIESSEAQSLKDALRRSEEKLHSVFANMSEGYAYHRIVLDAEGNPRDYVFLEVNHAFERLTGLKRENIIGRRATQALPGMEKDPADWIGTYGQVALSGKPVQFESYSQSLRRWYSISAFSPHRGFFAVTFSDITERREAEEVVHQANEQLQCQAEELQTQAEELNAQAEELRAANDELRNSERALRDSEQRLNRAQEIAHLGSWELDLVNGVLTWSDEVYRIFGFQPQQFGATYGTFLAAVHPDDRAAVDAAYVSSLQEGRLSYEIEHRILRRATGEVRWVHEKCRHVTDAAGKVIRSVGMVLDITERRQAREALRQSEERFRLLSETAGRLLTAGDPQEVVNDLCHKVMKHLDCQLFFNFLADDQAGRLRLNACAGIPDEEARRIEWLDYGVAVCGCVARDGVRIVAEEIPATRHPQTDMVRSYGVQAYACHPLLAEGKVIGTLSFGTRTRTRFSEDDLSLMKTVADQVAVAIQRILGERALRASEAQLQAVVENLDEGVVVADLQGRLLHWNRAALEMHEFASLEECRCRLPELGDVFELSTPDGVILPVEQWPLARILRGEALRDWEVRVRRLDSDRWRIFNYGGTLVRDAQGQPFMAVVTVGDITERKQAEDAVRSVALFPEQNPSPVLRIARDGTLLYANDSSADLLESWACGLGEAAPEEIRRDVAKALDLNEVMETEVPCGSIVYSFSIAPVASDGYANLYARDITERKHMEGQLRRLNDQLEEEVQAQTEELRDTVDRLQEEMTRRVGVETKLRKHSQMLEGFFQHTIAPLAFLDDRFNFVRVNEAYAAADGKSPEYFPGKNHFVLYPDDENRAIFEQVVRTRHSYRAYAKPFHYANASHRGVTYWNWQLTPLFDERGDVQFLVLNLEDVTERQRAFNELEHRARQLQQLSLELSQAEDRERRRLAEILHDDLQQQLAAAKFHLGILGSRIKDNLSVRNMVGQLDQILKDAIDKSRSLSHELSPAVLYQSDLCEIFEWLARQLQAKHGLTVYVDAAEPVHLHSEGMKTFLFKAAQEILFNVVKHARVKEARLRLRRARGTLRLTIGDQGQGFDPQMLRKSGGFGLLSIRERIELLGGRMRVKSVKGRGSVFAIVMPDSRLTEDGVTSGGKRPEAAGAPADSSLRPAAPASSPRLRVVLADDHKVMREGLAALLSDQADMDIVGQAGNGREAVNLTYSLHPDVVIMDIAMPVMAGDEATRQIKLHVPQTRVIALSMFEEAGVAEAVRKAGAEAYLLKTGPFEKLLAAVRGQTPA